MKYLCLTFQDETRTDAMNSNESESLAADSQRVLTEFRKGGTLVASAPALPSQATTTVRVRNGRLSITDGSVSGSREQLAGFFVIEARDLNEALRLSGRLPAARNGYVEVRPIPELVIDFDPLTVTNTVGSKPEILE